jgi:transposase-like protein
MTRESDKSLTQVARELGGSPSALRNWFARGPTRAAVTRPGGS